MSNPKTLAQIRAEAEREAKITFRTGYTCPDVALTEVAETVARQAFDACARAVMERAAELVTAIENNIPLAHRGSCNINKHKDLRELGCCCGKETFERAIANWTKFKEGNDEPG